VIDRSHRAAPNDVDDDDDDDDVWLDDANARDGTRERITTHIRRRGRRQGAVARRRAARLRGAAAEISSAVGEDEDVDAADRWRCDRGEGVRGKEVGDFKRGACVVRARWVG